ncbi:HEPN domain-containing protein [candidate division KSB1 bacterium]|nr:HEPN domain-containing protein [candidate division KSB1 bacterium]
MKNNYRSDLIQYRIERSLETLDEAEIMKREKHWNTSANRLYYACFYAVLALLEKDGFASSKHAGVKSMFNQHFVKTGKVSVEHGKLYNKLFDIRQEGDYIDFVHFDAEAIEPLFPRVKEFIDCISELVTKK